MSPSTKALLSETTVRASYFLKLLNTAVEHFKIPEDPVEAITWAVSRIHIENSETKKTIYDQECEFPDFYSNKARKIIASRYFKTCQGKPENSLKQLVHRVVNQLADWALADGYLETKTERKLYYRVLSYFLLNQYCAFNSPVWFNGGRFEKPQMSACFINSVEDSMESILDLIKIEGMLFKGGSGTGTNYSSIRGSKESLSAGGIASGPLSFIKALDASAGAIKSGGANRRAARMCILNDTHPDVEEFVSIKSKEEKKIHALVAGGFSSGIEGEAQQTVAFQNGNNTVRISHKFMRAVEANGEHNLINVRDRKIAKTLKAKDLWLNVAKNTWECGDPGVQFHDTIQSWNTLANSGEIEASNPCFTGDTLVATTDGRNAVPIKDLVGTTVDVYTWDHEKKKVVIAPMHSIRMTRSVAEVYRVVLDDGSSFKATPDHLIMLKNGEYRKVIDLKSGDSLNTFHSSLEYRANGSAYNHKVVSVEPAGQEDVYDGTVDKYHNFSIVTSGTLTTPLSGIFVHNCAEFLAPNNTSCNLSSVNLARFYTNRSFDYTGFESICKILILAKETIVGHAAYPRPEIEFNTLDQRHLGLGFTNLGSFMMSMGFMYDSQEARAMTAAITSLMTAAAYHTSTELAGVAGPFGAYEANKAPMTRVLDKHALYTRTLAYMDDTTNLNLTEEERLHLKQFTEIIWLPEIRSKTSQHILEIARYASSLWDRTLEQGAVSGYRNAQVTCLAPTGTISFFMDANTTGIEPVLSLIQEKTLVGGGSLTLVCDSVDKALASLGYSSAEAKAIEKCIVDNGTAEDCPALKSEHIEVFQTSFASGKGKRTLSWKSHIDMMAAAQPFLSGAISKTCNMPESSTPEDIANAYMYAWKSGIKCHAIYRDNSKSAQPLVTKKDAKVEKKRAKGERNKPEEVRSSITHSFDISGHKGYITVGLFADGKPAEIFVKMAKEGSTICGLMDAISVSASMALQYGCPLEKLVEKHAHTQYAPSGMTRNKAIPFAKSITDYIFRWMSSQFCSKEFQASMGVNGVTFHSTPEAEIKNALKPGFGDTQTCSQCGGLSIRRGTCYTCETCGVSSGCG